MSPLRSILLHLDASPRSAMRLSLARGLAAQHDATITAVYATAPSLLDLPLASAHEPADMVSMFERIYALRRSTARSCSIVRTSALPECSGGSRAASP